MFCIEDPKCWDDEVKQLIIQTEDNLLKENKDNDLYMNSEKRYFEGFHTPYRDKLFSQLRDYLLHQETIAYHCTRSTEEFLSRGLRVLNPKNHLDYVLDQLKVHLSDKEIMKIQEMANEYKCSGQFSNRENMIWYVLSEKLIKDCGCIDFYRYFGGEVIRRITYDIKEIVYPKLRLIGKLWL